MSTPEGDNPPLEEAEGGVATLAPMIIVTTDEVPGARIVRTLGECLGVTVRARQAVSDLGAGLRAMSGGGEMSEMTQVMFTARQEALSRLAAAAEQRGANAVVGYRFSTTGFGGPWAEVCAYGTAVEIAPLAGQVASSGS